MDIDVFPNSVEYWGPNGMVFFRNVQFRWMPVQGESRVTLALERPGASADQGVYAGRIELQDVRPHFPMPDISGEARLGRSWGYVEAAGMLRRIKWVDNGTDAFDLSGGAWGWGVNFSSNLKAYQEGCRQASARVWRRHPELHERRPGGCRHKAQPRQYTNPRNGRSVAAAWNRRVLRSLLE